MNRRHVFIVSLIIWLMAVGLLITGSSILTTSFPGIDHLPLGTLITWAGMIALPTSIYTGNKNLFNPTYISDVLCSTALKISIIIAILWVPVSYLLSGNIAFTFGNSSGFQGGDQAMKIFWYYSYGSAILPLILITLFGMTNLYRKLRK